MWKDFIKDIDLDRDIVEVRMKRIKDIHEYHLQRINHDESCISIMHDKKVKSMLLYDVKAFCSFYDYVKETVFQEQEFLTLLIAVLETMVKVSADKIVYIHLKSIFIHRTAGTIALLCLPVEKDAWCEADEECKQFLNDLLMLIKVEKAYELIGFLNQSIKQYDFKIVGILQQLIQRIPIPKKIPFWRKLLLRELEEIPVHYPLPKAKPMEKKDIVRQRYVKEIKPKENIIMNETVVLFENPQKANAYIEGSHHEKIDIYNDEFMIGRDKACNYIISSPTVSKHHVCIVKETTGFYIKDLNSSNSTYLNGEELNAMELYDLKDSDEIVLADEKLYFHYER